MTRKAQPSAAAVAQKMDAITKALAAARTHHVQGQLKLAEDFYLEALALNSNNPDALHMLGLVAFQTGRGPEGIRLMKRAARKSPRDAAIFVNLGAAYRQAGQKAEARDAYEAAIKLNPRLWEAHFNLGKLLTDLGDYEAATKAFQTCIAIDPTHPDAFLSLGNTYKFVGDGEKARAAYEHAIRLAPNMAQAYGNIAAVLVDQSKFAEALTFMDKAIAINPEPGELRHKRSLIALRLEQFLVGWADYESRYFAETEPVPRFPGPPADWAGEDLTGKTILIWTEQGVGDEILYASMIHEIVARARQCIVECSPRMVPVFARSFPRAKVVPYKALGVRTTPPAEFDTQISAASLGKYFRPNVASFPRHQGYLKADSALTAALRARYQAIAPGNMIVGLSWRSKNTEIGPEKSADLSTWGEVLLMPGVTFVSLQYGDCAKDLADVKGVLGVDIVQDPNVDPLKSMDDFFAQVAAMDMVITTSTATVHVAGSLNVPTCLLLTAGPASLWYWFLERADSPWYPAVQVFRKPSRDAASGTHWWHDGIVRVANALRLKSAERRGGVIVGPA